MALGGMSIEFCGNSQLVDGTLELWQVSSEGGGLEEIGAYWMDDGDWQLNCEMLATGRQSKPGTHRELPSVDILERASDLNIQEVADAKESPWAPLLDFQSRPVDTA